MSQILSQVPSQRLQQEQRLTPQLIQAMDILQLNALALESRIAEEVDSNPALEVVSDELPPPEEPGGPDPADREQDLVVGSDGNAADFARLDDLVREYGDWDGEDSDYSGTRSRGRALEASDNKAEALANTAARPQGLHEYLLEQWQMANVAPRIREIGKRIIEDLGAAGRLQTSLAEIEVDLDPPPSDDERADALDEVQQLDPPGIAARDVRECLLLQLDRLPGDNGLERRIVERHLDDLMKNRMPAIAKALNIDLDEVKDAVSVIASLSLQPGAEIAGPPPPAIVPDVVVEYDEATQQYNVRLTRSNTRELRISPQFRELLEQSRDDRKTRDFVRQRIEAANAIIDAVRFRRERLLDVARAVVEAQRDFLDYGEKHLKVLRMSDLAARFHCDPSTISRTVDEKYIETPRGTYPLRYFFTGGTGGADGGEVDGLGWASIKALVAELVAGEDKANPLNDDQIVELLGNRGVDIKRRTVAKYRAQLNIPSARQRRRY